MYTEYKEWKEVSEFRLSERLLSRPQSPRTIYLFSEVTTCLHSGIRVEKSCSPHACNLPGLADSASKVPRLEGVLQTEVFF